MDLTIPQALEVVARLLGEQRTAEAEKLVVKILAAEPNHPEAEFLLAKVFLQRGLHDAALHSFERTLWLRPVLRWRVIQCVIAVVRARVYLEIGVNLGDNLSHIWAPIKIGVDPVAPAPATAAQTQSGALRYYQMTSDRFFADPPVVLQSEGMDVAFVDGLHTHGQVLQDTENCLKYLNRGGVILLHDCNPPNEAIATPAASLQDAAGKNVPGWTGAWSGDVWKAIALLRATRPELQVSVLDCDWGIGVVQRRERPEPPPLCFTAEQIAALSYRDLDTDRANILGLRQPPELMRLLRGNLCRVDIAHQDT